MTSLQRFYQAAKSLKPHAAAVLLHMMVEAERNGTNVVKGGAEQIAAALNASKPRTIEALRDLQARCFITTRVGRPGHPSVHQVNTLITDHSFSSQKEPSGENFGSNREPTSVPNGNLEGVNWEPTADENKRSFAVARAVESKDLLEASSILDRRDRAKINDFDPAIVASCRTWMRSYLAKFPDPALQQQLDRGGKLPAGPDDTILAKFLYLGEGVGGWPRLERLFYDLMAERRTLGGWAWFVAVAQQRLHGITADQAKRHRELKLLRKAPAAKPHAPPQQQSFPDVHQRDDSQRDDWAQQLQRTAALKKLG